MVRKEETVLTLVIQKSKAPRYNRTKIPSTRIFKASKYKKKYPVNRRKKSEFFFQSIFQVIKLLLVFFQKPNALASEQRLPFLNFNSLELNYFTF